MTEVIVASAAEADFTQSLCWYAERNIDAAQAFDGEFDRAVAQIAENPQRFPRCDDRHRFYLMRRFPFQIIFRIMGDDVVIIAVAHVARDPNYWTNR